MQQRKNLIIGIALVISLLLLVGLGPYMTGNIVADLNSLDLEHYPYPFIKNNAYNYFSIVIPDFPSQQEEEAAQILAESLQERRPQQAKIIKESQIQDERANFIVIREYCENCNPKTAQLDLEVGTNFATLTISSDVLKGAKVLANYQLIPLTGKEMIISGNPERSSSLRITSK